jgi:subtilisin family serine protease
MNYAVNGATGPAAAGAIHNAIESTGGRVLVAYPEIGVTIAQSTRADFAPALAAAGGVESVGPTRTRAVTDGEAPPAPMPLAETVTAPSDPDLPDEGAAWDVAATRTTAAHAVTTGAPEVVVGIADTGIDDTHPDLVGRVDGSRSVGCSVNGVADTDRSAWLPTSSPHGTHVAGTVGAMRNDSGIVGVAPSTRLAAIKVDGVGGHIYPEYSICGIMWAASQKMDVVNHSYFVDPWVGWCPDQPSQAAALEATRRAYSYADDQGVLSIAASGNASIDFDARTTDAESPNDGKLANRPVTAACTYAPAGLPGVLGVGASELEAASGDLRYATLSNYGGDTVDMVAPGISIWSATPPQGDALYAPFPGTSMASPHVAGAAALVKSRQPQSTPADISKILTDSARAGTCPPGVADCPDVDPRRVGAGHLDVAAALGIPVPDATPSIGITTRKMSTTEPSPVIATGFRAGETVRLRLTQGSVVQELTSVTADARGDVHASVRVAPTAGSEPVLLSAVGQTSAVNVSTPVRVTVGVAAPSISSPSPGAILPVGIVTVSGTALPGAAIGVTLTKPTWDPNTDGALPKPPAAAPGEPVPFDPSTGLSIARTVADAAGMWSVTFAVPANGYSVSARQRVDGVVSAPGTAVAFEAAAVVPTAPPTPAPTPTATPTAPPTETPMPQPTAGTGGSLPGSANASAAASGSPEPSPTPDASSSTGSGPGALAASGASDGLALTLLAVSGALVTGGIVIAARAHSVRPRIRP